MTKHAFTKVFGTRTQKYFTPRQPHIKICSDPYGHHRSRFDPNVNRFDAEGASSTILRSFAIHQQDQPCLNPETHDPKTYTGLRNWPHYWRKNCSHKAETEERNYVC
jgi:hypothetical protein